MIRSMDGNWTKTRSFIVIASITVVLSLFASIFVMDKIAFADDASATSSYREFEVQRDLIKTTVPMPMDAVDADNTASTTVTKKVDWQAPTGEQPDLSKYSSLSIEVSIRDQKTQVLSNGHAIYEMISSTGIDDSTPRGNFTIGSRGESFYNPSEGMGAKYWVGFIGSTYLFHSVPTDANGDWIVSEAEKLGKPASHGCVRLTVSDAKWLHDSIPAGTPVHIS